MAVGAAVAGGAIIGGIAGSQKKTSRTTSGLNLDDPGELERLISGLQPGQLQSLIGLVGRGPGGQDVTAALQSQRGLAEQFRLASETGGLPGQEDISAAQGISGQLFAPQQLALQQSFEDQRTRSAQEAVRLGRPVTDPVLANLLARTQGRQTALLGARQGAVSQQIALNLPFQRLQLAQQGSQILGGLGTQAFQNRSAVLGLGSGLLGAERSFRIQTADRFGKTTSGGGLGGALTGALGGAGAGLSAAGTFGTNLALQGFLGGGGGGGGFQQQIPGAKTFPGGFGQPNAPGGFFPFAG